MYDWGGMYQFGLDRYASLVMQHLHFPILAFKSISAPSPCENEVGESFYVRVEEIDHKRKSRQWSARRIEQVELFEYLQEDDMIKGMMP